VEEKLLAIEERLATMVWIFTILIVVHNVEGINIHIVSVFSNRRTKFRG
jgi:hypothetical protein